uniref:CSON002695 protein n=1 Tax=Culicoides sonorensis TaxID=179676 RepID=A0A336LSL5_CULSO
MGGGKAEKGTPKYLANKMKAKGLQKLRWYCQMCQKQCRDENGFKCHTMSESHQRQMLLFSDNAGRYIDSFSKEFSDGYLYLLRRQFGTKRVLANRVYQDFIADKNHLHMNATKWYSLTEFVKWLGRTGQCTVDETEKGWYITYIDRDPETLARQEKLARKEKQEKDDEERHQEYIRQQVEKGQKQRENDEPKELKEFVRENEEEPLKLDLKLVQKPKPEPISLKSSVLMSDSASNSIGKRKSDNDSDGTFKKPKSVNTSRSLSTIEEVIKQEEEKKERMNRKDYWLHEDIIVKLITKSLGDKFYKQKARVLEVIDKYQAKIKLLETGEKLKVDQAHVETVIPNLGKHVKVVNGAYRGHLAILKALDEANYCVTIQIASGTFKDRIVKGVQYEDICKIYEK